MEKTQDKIGNIITSGERDAVHIAVLPVIAHNELFPGCHIGYDNGKTTYENTIGIVDPFLNKKNIEEGEMFFMFLYPNTITSLRHNWTHPSISEEVETVSLYKGGSEKWMTKWAVEHLHDDYEDGDVINGDALLKYAIQCGHDLSVGMHEDARDHIDGEWWTHWENITGEKGKREEYFTCSC